MSHDCDCAWNNENEIVFQVQHAQQGQINYFKLVGGILQLVRLNLNFKCKIKTANLRLKIRFPRLQNTMRQ